MTGARTVLVTGAAGAIGGATTALLLQEGFAVVGLDRADTVTTAQDHPAYVGVVGDAAEEGAVTDALRATIGDRPLHHVVGVAGGALPSEPRTAADPGALEVAEFTASVQANLVSQFTVVRAALPFLRSGAGDRSITLTSSFNALTAQGMPAYSAAKAGLTGLMHGLVVPLGRDGIRVNVVAPGTIRTPRTERIWGHVDGHFERLEAGTALGRLGTPEDVARAYLAVITLLTHVTGTVLVVDGGQSVIT